MRLRRKQADAEQAVEATVEQDQEQVAAVDPQTSQGPLDASELEPDASYVDLGSLLVQPPDGLDLRLQVDEQTGTVMTVLLINHDPTESVTLARGDRIAQLVIQRFESASFVEADDLPESARGVGGYGSTGGFSAQAPDEVRAGGTTT